MSRLLLALPLAALLASSAPAQSVWVVDASGAGDHDDLQAAVDAAGQGDTLLVKTGSYGDLFISNKSLRIVGDADPRPVIGGATTVRDLGLQREVVIAGVDLRGELLVDSCAASVMFDSCRVRAPGLNPPPASGNLACLWLENTPHCVLDSEDVSFVECALLGRNGAAPGGAVDGGDGETGLFVNSSNVVLYGCFVTGGYGGTCACNGSSCSGGDGGSGLEVYGTSRVLLDRTTPAGGDGGFANQCTSGCDGQDVRIGSGAVVEAAQHPDARMLGPFVIRRDAPLELKVVAPPGARVFLVMSAEPERRAFGSGIGVLHCATPSTMQPVGTVLPVGELKLSLAFPPLPGVDFEQLVAQVFVTSATQRYLTNPRAVVVLDTSF